MRNFLLLFLTACALEGSSPTPQEICGHRSHIQSYAYTVDADRTSVTLSLPTFTSLLQVLHQNEMWEDCVENHLAEGGTFSTGTAGSL